MHHIPRCFDIPTRLQNVLHCSGPSLGMANFAEHMHYCIRRAPAATGAVLLRVTVLPQTDSTMPTLPTLSDCVSPQWRRGFQFHIGLRFHDNDGTYDATAPVVPGGAGRRRRIPVGRSSVDRCNQGLLLPGPVGRRAPLGGRLDGWPPAHLIGTGASSTTTEWSPRRPWLGPCLGPVFVLSPSCIGPSLVPSRPCLGPALVLSCSCFGPCLVLSRPCLSPVSILSRTCLADRPRPCDPGQWTVTRHSKTRIRHTD